MTVHPQSLGGVSGAVLLLALAGCGGAQTAHETVTTPEPEAEPVPQQVVSIALAPLTLVSSTAEGQPPMTAELDAEGHVTSARCGATSLSREGVLRRDDVIVARLTQGPTGLSVLDGEGHDSGLVLRQREIATTDGEVRFQVTEHAIVSSQAPAPRVEIQPANADEATALALFATLLICNDVGP